MKHDIFPIPTWHIEGRVPQQLIDELYQGAYRFKKSHPSENKSNEGGYQSPAFSWEMFHPQGIEYIEKIVGDTFEFKVEVESWWYNINGKGHWNTPHIHTTHFALVWYLTDSNGLLQLMNPFPQRHNSLTESMSVNGKKGSIVIFPSDLIHYVKPKPKDEDRISISMNLQLC